jgi:hypothetical protein
MWVMVMRIWVGCGDHEADGEGWIVDPEHGDKTADDE